VRKPEIPRNDAIIMPSVNVRTRDGLEHIIVATLGSSVMEAIRDNGIDEMLAICGGCLSCATCHVLVDDAWQDKLPAPSEEENELLDGAEGRQQNSRLSCQIVMNADIDGLRLTIAPD
jgi:2Fe-2S ferredoxin